MSKKKGVSLEEKRRIILDIYHTTKGVFNLKEIESAGAKRGVTLQTVKDVNQGLIEDGLVDTDKIGSGNFYWSFPSKALQQAKNLAEATEAENARLRAVVVELQARKAQLSEGQKDSETRKRKLKELEDLRALKAKNDAELQRLKENDPEELEKTEDQIRNCKRSINRWIDNGFAIKHFLVKKKGVPGKDVDKLIQTYAPHWNDELDYFEE